MAADLLSTICDEIDERLGELRLRLAEYEQLLVAADALVATGAAIPEIVPDTPRSAAPAKPRQAKVTAVKPKQARVGRPRKAAAEAAPEASVKSARAPRGAAREAILAALDHGSHTVGELAVVTAMSTANINGNVRRLVAEGAVAKTEREGKTAYALAAA
jgi:DNA-binding transcriptional ArsR family regulator